MITFRKDGAEIHIVLSDGDSSVRCMHLNTYLPDNWRIFPDAHIWVLQNLNTEERYVYLPGMTIWGDTVLNATPQDYEQTTRILYEVERYSAQLVKIAMSNPRIIRNISCSRCLPGKVSPCWEDHIKSGEIPQELYKTVVAFIPETYSSEGLLRRFFARDFLLERVFPFEFNRPPEKKRPQSLAIDKSMGCRACKNYHGTQYSGASNGGVYSERLICGLYPYGWNGSGEAEAYLCPDYDVNERTLSTVLNRQDYNSLSSNSIEWLEFLKWKDESEVSLGQFKVRKLGYKKVLWDDRRYGRISPEISRGVANAIKALLGLL